MNTPAAVVEEQKQVCAKFGAEFRACADEERAGVAIATLKEKPIYGVRRTNTDGSASWYIWGGPHSPAADFYQPMCASHLVERVPIVRRYLALPPGFKFIVDQGGYEDVWFENENRV